MRIEPLSEGRRETPGVRAGEGIFRLRDGELTFDYRDFTNRPQRRWRREQIADVYVEPLEGSRGKLSLKLTDGAVEQFGRQSNHRAAIAANALRKLLGFEPVTEMAVLPPEPSQVQVESDEAGVTIKPLFCASPTASNYIFGGLVVMLFLTVWGLIAARGLSGSHAVVFPNVLFVAIAVIGIAVSLICILHGLKRRQDRMQIRIAGGQVAFATKSRDGALLRSLELAVRQITGVNVHMTQPGKGGPIFGLQIYRSDAKPELLLNGVEEKQLEELADALHAALKLESREENAQRWLGQESDQRIEVNGHVIAYQPEASEEQILLRTPGRLKVMIPPLRMKDLRQKRGFGIACTIVAIVVAWTCVFVFIAHTYLPCVFLSIGACVAAYAMRDAVAHVTLEVNAKELSRDVRPLWFGRIVRRFDVGSIREIVVIPHSAQVAVHIGKRAERLAFMRTPAEAEELASKLRAALGLVRSA